MRKLVFIIIVLIGTQTYSQEVKYYLYDKNHKLISRVNKSDLNDLEKGVYYLQIIEGKQIKECKIIVDEITSETVV